jgi:2,4-dienoyl-CoA reductase-like NADH-dependent reductase (Old Yellow Enzyme family)
VGPSAPDSGDAAQPRALSVEEIHAIEQRFAEAAARAIAAGFDAVEVHGAHGFLLDSFLMKKRNRRTDAYGGSIAGRMRMLVETCQRIRSAIPDRALLTCRVSIFNKRDEGFAREDFEQLLHGLARAGIDLLHISTDGAFKGYFATRRSIGRWARSICNLPIIVAGGLGNAADAERAVAGGHCDFAAIGRAMFDDPQWTAKARQALG